MRFRLTVLCLLSALLLAGCFEEVLDFRNAEISNGKLYQAGANEPFSGKVTNVPYSKLPHDAMSSIFDIAWAATQVPYPRNRHLCDAPFSKGVLDGDVVCAIPGTDEPSITMRYEKGSLEGTVKATSPSTEDVTRIEAFYKNNVLEGELIINHPQTGAHVNKSQWRAGKLHGLEEGYSMTSGKLAYKAAYVDGKLEGEHLAYDSDGIQVIKKTTFAAGRRHGVEEEYSPEGQLIMRGHWTEDLKDGVFEKWNPQGQLVQTQLWNRGIGDWSNKSPSQQTSGGAASAASSTECVDGWTAAFRKESGQDAMVTHDQLEEWKDWCRQGKIAQ